VRLIDTHCHLYYRERLGDPNAVVERALAAGIERLICIGTNTETSRISVELAEQFDEVFATVGWHPTEAQNYKRDEIREIKHLAAHRKVVGIGEIGFDFHWDVSTPHQQEECFLDHHELACELGLPMVFHCREAYSHMLDRLEVLPPHPGLFHCFGGDAADAARALKLDCYFGVDGPLTYPKSNELRDLVASLPRDKVLLETDAPFLPPQPYRGKANEPSYLVHVNQKLAEVWGLREEQSAEITTANAERFFRLPYR